MRNIIYFVHPITLIGFVILFSSCRSTHQTNESRDFPIGQIDQSLNLALKQAKFMSESLKNRKNVLPRSASKEGELITSDPAWWTSGFFPGELWYLYEYSGEELFKKNADKFSMFLFNQQYSLNNHDIGFMLFCSFGNGFRLTKNEKYKDILITGAHSLMQRYNPKLGLIRSWDFNKDIWQYPVIIDNMMNLELLFWVAKTTNDSVMYRAAISHADKTMKYHFRPNFSCWHVVSYDTINGLPHIRQTHQGIDDDSSWSRGQSWALYSYTMVYRETKEQRFLNHAVNIANYIIHHPSMPEDKIPLWDFDASPDAPRDASSAAIIASALIELSQYNIDNKYKNEYLNFAKEQLISLSSGVYLAEVNTNSGFVIKHSTGNYPSGYEIDAPLSYADYYYVEALLRYREQLRTKTRK